MNTPIGTSLLPAIHPGTLLKRLFALCLLALCTLTASATVQRFFNLTAEDIRIDSVIPHFSHTLLLGPNYADSTYTVDILYPEFIDMSSDDVARYLQLSGGSSLPALPVARQHVAVSRRQGRLCIEFQPFVFRDGRYQTLVSFMLKVTAQPRQAATGPLTAGQPARQPAAAARQQLLPAADSPASRYAEHSVLATGRWAKIGVKESGIYQLTDEVIRKAGFTDLNKVKIYGYGGNLQPEVLTPDFIANNDDLSEVPQCIVGGRHLFYALGPVSWSSATATTRTRNPYSDYGCYFITESDSSALTIGQEAFLAEAYPRPENYHVLHEVDNYAWFQGGRNLYENTPINQGSTKTYTLASPVSNCPATLSITVSAGQNSVANIAINGRSLGSILLTLISYEKGRAVNATYSLSAEDVKPQNEITITTQSGGPLRLDFIDLVLSEPTPQPNLESDTFAAPDYIYNITNQDLHAHTPVDMTIIIPTSQKLLTQAERLADFHQSRDSLSVRIVPADEIYNEFSSGTPDATAYKRYMKMLYDRVATSSDLPRYLLLFGDCAWDNRMLTADWRYASPDDYLLCFESENSFSETYCYVSEEFFCMLDDNEVLTSGSYPNERPRGLADIAVGRFPVSNDTDAKTLVDKVIAYATDENAGPWQNTLVFMGDDANNNIHMRDINDVAESIAARYPGFLIKKVMWDAYVRETSSTGNSYPEVSKLVKQYQTNGALIMDYAGHGRADQLSHENVLRLTDFEQFSNTNLPLWITASCDLMPFDGSVSTIGEAAVLNNKGGAIAFFGTARTVFTTQNKHINASFMKHVLSMDGGKPITMGEAQRRAKNEVITEGLDRSVNLMQFQLLGDPALALKRPTYQVVVDSIDGIPATASTRNKPTLKAGAIARVSGHIENAPDFNGIVNVTVRDNLETITCKLNDTSGAETPFTYTDRTKTLYTGSDSVRAGRFSFVFAVPKDINYADADGLINAYALNDSHTMRAHGENNQFIIGGTATTGNDSIGPSIYCYLNSPSFTNGGNVNTTPFFVAEVTDQNGINTSGNGIGHDLELIIDGQMERTYMLNDNFVFDFGSYTRGTTFFNIPELEVGPHKLLFRAWDVLNNSSTAELSFNVVRGLRPNLLSVSCTQNPARTATTFIIAHDRSGSAIDVTLEVFDMSGRLLWRHEESGVPSTQTYTVDWNLTVDGGQRLDTGVYLYRVRVASDGSAQASKAQKIVIINS